MPTDQSFLWPPKPAPPPQPMRPPPIQVRRPNRFIDSIEKHLLGRTGYAFDRWALETGWIRDHPSTYCWRCGSSIGPFESDGEGCADCRTKNLPWERSIRLGPYAGKLRSEVLALKFHSWRPTGRGLGKHLGRAIADQLAYAQIPVSQAMLVPIPTHRIRRISRGVDHTMVLARAASVSSGCRVLPILFTKYRPEQIGLSMTARAQNMKDAFFVAPKRLSWLAPSKNEPPRVIVLIDDVRTTGATFVAASRALKAGFCANLRDGGLGANRVEIWTGCVGVASEPRRRKMNAQG